MKKRAPKWILVEGQEEGELQHDMMGVYTRMDAKEVNGREVWKAAREMERFIFYASDNKWYLGKSAEDMEAGNPSGQLSVAGIGAITPDLATSTWWQLKDANGGWIDGPGVRVLKCSASEYEAHMEKKQWQRQRSLSMGNVEVNWIMIEGQGAGEPRFSMMGPYVRMNGQEVNGRGVWQAAGGKEQFLFYASNGQFFIGTSQVDMTVGKPAGHLSVACAGDTPDKATGHWQMGQGDGRWVDVPKIRARPCSSDEYKSAVQQQQEEMQQAMVAAKEVRKIKIEGQEDGDCQYSKMGTYRRMEGREVNGRGVWQMEAGIFSSLLGGETTKYLFYASDQWFIGTSKRNMDTGNAAGGAKVVDSAITPDKITGTWKVADDAGGWVDAAHMRAVNKGR
jgi:hypothetical protein